MRQNKTHPKYIVFDLETTITDGSASAFDPKNRIVLGGYKEDGKDAVCSLPDFCRLLDTTVVGQNIAFDMAYVARTVDLLDFVQCGNTIWDTQIAEYVLTGQQSKMVSLDQLAAKYGGTLKDSAVSDMFKAGLGADQIDPDVLKDYFTGDLVNTELVFRKQWEEAERTGKLALIRFMNHARLMTCIMQCNGMVVDTDGLMILRSRLEAEQRDLDHRLTGLISDAIAPAVAAAGGTVDPELIQPTSSMLSCYLYGGRATIPIKVPTGEVYKTGTRAGQQKVKTQHLSVQFSKLVEPTKPTKSSVNYSLIHPLDEDVLEDIKNKHLPLATAYEVADLLLKKRRVDKMLGTYVDGVLKNVYPSDGKVHPDYNHTVTNTGRLSCSNPNLQNQDGEIKKYYLPQPGHKVLIEFDFKQLEVCALAHLSGDPQLIADINNGVDLHYETGRTVFGWKSPADMDEATRRGVKGVNFGLIYGGTTKGLAATTGFPEAVVSSLINAFYTRYPRVKTWQTENIEAVNRNRQYTAGVHGLTAAGYPAGESVLTDWTGRSYVFKEYDAPEWLVQKGQHTSFSPTEIKNYPVQGFATADIVPITLAVLMNWLAQSGIRNIIRAVNTVHDSFKLSCSDEGYARYMYMKVQEEVMPLVTAVLKDVFGIEMKVPLKVDAKMGLNWGDMKKIDLT